MTPDQTSIVNCVTAVAAAVAAVCGVMNHFTGRSTNEMVKQSTTTPQPKD